MKYRQGTAKAEVRKHKRHQLSSSATHLKPDLPEPLQRAMELSQEKGALSWLTALPIEEIEFALHKGAFRGALALRYGWQPLRTPTHCACGN